MDLSNPGPIATSADNRWTFRAGTLVGPSGEHSVFEMDWFERWTFAKFLSGGELVLGFETSQPYNEWGSSGSRLWGMQVLAQTDITTWTLVSLEYELRDHDEVFEPDDIDWHPRSAWAWVEKGELWVQVRAEPRGHIAPSLVPPPDNAGEILLEYYAYGEWTELAFSDDGRHLFARDEDGTDDFDLEARQRCRNDGPWMPIEEPRMP